MSTLSSIIHRAPREYTAQNIFHLNGHTLSFHSQTLRTISYYGLRKGSLAKNRAQPAAQRGTGRGTLRGAPYPDFSRVIFPTKKPVHRLCTAL